MNEPPKLINRAHRRQDCIFIGAWVSEAMARAIDEAAKLTDLDRSKILRRALEKKVSQAACALPNAAERLNQAPKCSL